MNAILRRKRSEKRQRGQGLVEFALVLPVLLLVILGLIEASRLVFFWALTTTASREGARYASTLLQYYDCSGIENAALRPGQFVGMTAGNVAISYDKGPGQASYAICGSLNPSDVVLGDRVTVTASSSFAPVAGLVTPPFQAITISSTTSRTIPKEIQLWGEEDGGGGGGGGGGGANAPVVNINQPADSTSHALGSAIIFDATATDLEDGVLTPSITWSSDLDGGLGTGGVLNLSGLSQGTHVITASVTDSDLQSDSDAITIIVDGGPTIGINTPADGQTVAFGSNVTFTGHAEDAEDGVISHQIAWTSSINGNLGNGNSVSTTSLSAGVHTISATVTDSTGITATATITLNVVAGSNTPPTVTIITPPNNWTYPQYPAITFSANAVDAEDGPLNSSIVWTSDVDGFLANGSTFASDTLAITTHVITATVTDSGGLSGSASITLTIRPGAPVPPVYVSYSYNSSGNKCVDVSLTWTSPTGADAWSQYSVGYRLFESGNSNPQAILGSNDPGNTTSLLPNFNNNHTETYEVEAQFSGNYVSDRLSVTLYCDKGTLILNP